MKSLNQTSRLKFNKAIVTELNDDALLGVHGKGDTNEPTTYVCSNCVVIPKTIQTILK